MKNDRILGEGGTLKSNPEAAGIVKPLFLLLELFVVFVSDVVSDAVAFIGVVFACEVVGFCCIWDVVVFDCVCAVLVPVKSCSLTTIESCSSIIIFLATVDNFVSCIPMR